MRRLLVLSCSQRKRPDDGLRPAIERYDGPAFRILRRYLRDPLATPPITFVLSAGFGLIPLDAPIPNYDQRMTAERAEALRSDVLRSLNSLAGRFDDIGRLFVFLGRDYLPAIAGIEAHFSPTTVATYATGTFGARLGQLKDWLYDDGNARPARPSARPDQTARPRPPTIRGRLINLSTAAILDVARRALQRDPVGADQFSRWYVPLDDRRVAPKWLVSQLTNLPVAAFTTSEAIRLLTQLGVDVCRA